MRKVLKQTMAIILCVTLIYVLLHYSFMVSSHSMHYCNTLNCSACSEIQQAKGMFSFSKPTGPNITACVVAVVLFVGFYIKVIYPKHRTLITQKVRLDD
ncbi:MAG: hypothetical protein Q4D77_06375 [Peptostreptococcaceae bacterium]|nr:hypothetical protein [Peptostreptococcaceae bacterium]